MRRFRIPLTVRAASTAAFTAAFLAASAAAASGPKPASAAGSGDAAFRLEVKRFVEENFALHPELATE